MALDRLRRPRARPTHSCPRRCRRRRLLARSRARRDQRHRRETELRTGRSQSRAPRQSARGVAVAEDRPGRARLECLRLGDVVAQADRRRAIEAHHAPRRDRRRERRGASLDAHVRVGVPVVARLGAVTRPRQQREPRTASRKPVADAEHRRRRRARTRRPSARLGIRDARRTPRSRRIARDRRQSRPRPRRRAPAISLGHGAAASPRPRKPWRPMPHRGRAAAVRTSDCAGCARSAPPCRARTAAR